MKTFSEFVNEASLGRIYQHIKDDKPFAAMTAFRKSSSKKENLQNNKVLKSLVKSADFGFVEVVGSYPEPQDDGEVVVVKENSIFIFGKRSDDEEVLKKLVKQLGKKYEQDSVLFKYSSGKIVLLYMDGRSDAVLDGVFHPNKIGDYMSRMKNGKTFTIESMKEEPESNAFYMERMIRQKFRDSILTNENAVEEKLSKMTFSEDFFEDVRGTNDDPTD
jgi:hypothetical protein